MSTNKSQEMKRQGDVLVVKVKSFPKEVKEKLKKKQNVHLAEGEVTGHYHCLVGEASVAEHENEVFFEIKSDTKITHQEHLPIQLEPGKYKKIQQVEYSPDAYRNVAD